MSKCRLVEQRDRIRGAMYNPADKNKMILYGSTYMCLVDIHDKPTPKKLGKRKNNSQNDTKTKPSTATTDDDIPVSISYQYQQILSCGFLGPNQMVMIERPKFSVLENLPPSFYKAHFGA
jgi:U3 small nucleolar RNA-associated protein 4